MKLRRATQALTLWPTDRPTQPVTATLSYDATDGYMVRLAFLRGRTETVVYHFPRSVLREGLNAEVAGPGVSVSPHEDLVEYLMITLFPEGAYPYALYADRAPIEAFVLRTYALVPGGQEDVDMDAGIEAAIAAILRSEVTS